MCFAADQKLIPVNPSQTNAIATQQCDWLCGGVIAAREFRGETERGGGGRGGGGEEGGGGGGGEGGGGGGWVTCKRRTWRLPSMVSWDTSPLARVSPALYTALMYILVAQAQKTS